MLRRYAGVRSFARAAIVRRRSRAATIIIWKAEGLASGAGGAEACGGRQIRTGVRAAGVAHGAAWIGAGGGRTGVIGIRHRPAGAGGVRFSERHLSSNLRPVC